MIFLGLYWFFWVYNLECSLNYVSNGGMKSEFGYLFGIVVNVVLDSNEIVVIVYFGFILGVNYFIRVF